MRPRQAEPQRRAGPDDKTHLMPNPAAFDSYVEQIARVTATSLIHSQRNLYGVPCERAHTSVSVRAYPDRLVVVCPSADEPEQPSSCLAASSVDRPCTTGATTSACCSANPAPCAMALRSKPCPSPCNIFRLVSCVTQAATA